MVHKAADNVESEPHSLSLGFLVKNGTKRGCDKLLCGTDSAGASHSRQLLRSPGPVNTSLSAGEVPGWAREGPRTSGPSRAPYICDSDRDGTKTKLLSWDWRDALRPRLPCSLSGAQVDASTDRFSSQRPAWVSSSETTHFSPHLMPYLLSVKAERLLFGKCVRKNHSPHWLLLAHRFHLFNVGGEP